VLIELCRQVEDYCVSGTVVHSVADLDWRQILGATERAMVQVLQQHGPVLDRSTFERACLSLGVKQHTFDVYVAWSPVVTRLAPSVYALRGAQVAPGMVEPLASRRRRGTVLMDYGWGPDRTVWLAYRVSAKMLSQGCAYIPAAMRQFVGGEFDLASADGAEFGHLRTDSGYATGLVGFLRRRGCELGDHLVILLHLQTRQAVVHVGDAGLLDEFRALQADRPSSSSTTTAAR
jgi:hypothetical protein